MSLIVCCSAFWKTVSKNFVFELLARKKEGKILKIGEERAGVGVVERTVDIDHYYEFHFRKAILEGKDKGEAEVEGESEEEEAVKEEIPGE